MNWKDLFSWAGFTGIGGGATTMSIPEGMDLSGTQRSGLSFGTKFLIAAGLTIVGVYTVRRLLK